ncbi:hypothetical protein S2M10_26100 [Sphingomonas sp. S2M10]|uniref:hypothetical protein n=1 Tax=Sphingomonas sp. S2M10 TaxID=2705010 RepID=UPI001457560A|nr:hypothetical protein [Sphingomonas sp. S2M10]NLS27611.1 hypothetical protein [Sphingomonas sp. S2M10]
MHADVDDLARLWQQDDQESTLSVVALSQRAVRRARLIERVEMAVAGLLIALIAFAVWRKFSLETLLVAIAIIAFILWSTYTHYRLRRVEWGAEQRERQQFVEGQIVRYNARIRRTIFDLILFGPLSVFAMMFSSLRQSVEGRPLTHLLDHLWNWPTLLGLAAMGATVAYLVVRLRRQRQVVRRLTGSLVEYRREAAMDRAALGQ